MLPVCLEIFLRNIWKWPESLNIQLTKFLLFRKYFNCVVTFLSIKTIKYWRFEAKLRYFTIEVVTY